MTIRMFWAEGGTLSRAALALAAASLVVNAGTYVGLRARGSFEALYLMHLLVMLLMLVLMVRSTYTSLVDGWRVARGRATRSTLVPVPAPLLWGAILSLLYLLGIVAYSFVRGGEGGAEVREGRDVWVHAGRVVRELGPGELQAFERLELRVFSAAWLFGALLVALMGRRVLSEARQDPAPSPASAD